MVVLTVGLTPINDLAPRPPHNLTATVEEGFVKLTWNKNTEADFSHYRIYRDTAYNSYL